MKKYCFDTSGFTNPLHDVPEDIHATFWERLADVVKSGAIAVTPEIYGELKGTIWSPFGKVIDTNAKSLVLEIGDVTWNYTAYIAESARMQQVYASFISENLPNHPDNTICLNDLTVVCLAKAMNIPLVGMETTTGNSLKYKRIPDICTLEQIQHLTFNEFLRKEGIRT